MTEANPGEPHRYSPDCLHPAEIKRINERRGEDRVKWMSDTQSRNATEEKDPPGVIFDHAGLAFSGGGIRSAAICMGVAQALDVQGLFSKFDYLSTVSGGGYTGCSIVAGMKASGKFPFSVHKEGAPDASRINDLQDSAAVSHVRDYSNYLMPHGLSDLGQSLAVLMRGMVASLSLVVGPLFLLAAATAATHPSDGAKRSFFLIPDAFGYFPVTTGLLIAFLIFLMIWAMRRSLDSGEGRREREFPGNWPRIGWWLFLALLGTAFLEAQIPLLNMMRADASQKGLLAWLLARIGSVSAYLAPAAALISFFASRLSAIEKANAASPTWRGWSARIVSRLLLVFAALVMPLLLWSAWLHLTAWAIAPGEPPALTEIAEPRSFLIRVYLAIGVVLTVFALCMEPNANSLHRLYRDRLSKAFLFDPRVDGASRRSRMARPGESVTPLDSARLSEQTGNGAPYLLINTALNIQRSAYVNARGRNADFFLFSPLFTGSHATDYLRTSELEERHPALDLGTAMAISGAAASSNMGAQSIRILAPTLALLNIRLGYWMLNPRRFALSGHIEGAHPQRHRKSAIPRNLYLFAEMFALLDETSPLVYLTDGGHIENLGVYELLKRRCRLILAVDAEADPTMSFGSLVALERYARIDLGIRLDAMPWQEIRSRSLACGRDIEETTASGAEPRRQNGPHIAVGRIIYPDAPPGILVYLKSSLTGDENDYIIDYKRRNPTFPHETTGDQFFSEAQFEAYRALGFHMMNRALMGEDFIAGLGPAGSELSALSQAEQDAVAAACGRRLRDLISTRDLTGRDLPD